MLHEEQVEGYRGRAAEDLQWLSKLAAWAVANELSRAVALASSSGPAAGGGSLGDDEAMEAAFVRLHETLVSRRTLPSSDEAIRSKEHFANLGKGFRQDEEIMGALWEGTLHLASTWFLRVRAELAPSTAADGARGDAELQAARQNWRWAAEDYDRLVRCGVQPTVVEYVLLMTDAAFGHCILTRLARHGIARQHGGRLVSRLKEEFTYLRALSRAPRPPSEMDSRDESEGDLMRKAAHRLAAFDVPGSEELQRVANEYGDIFAEQSALLRQRRRLSE